MGCKSKALHPVVQDWMESLEGGMCEIVGSPWSLLAMLFFPVAGPGIEWHLTRNTGWCLG